MVDHVFERLMFSPHADMDASAPHHPKNLQPVPWDTGDEPRVTIDSWSFLGIGRPLPQVASVIVTWTAAEWEAMCDVLAPNSTEFQYTTNFSSYAADLTVRSPARFAKCLARYRAVIGPNNTTVLLMHSMLHVATDGPNLPLRQLFNQIIEETSCKKIITTGTAGGIGADKELGDIVVGDACQFNCHRTFKSQPFNGVRYPTTLPPQAKSTIPLVAANFGQLSAVNKGGFRVDAGDIETTDFFAFDTSTDHFGLQQADPKANIVEMDDAVLGLVMADRMTAAKSVPLWGAVRNVSDPQANMSNYATFEDASRDMGRIYRRYGFWTTIPSVIESWLMAIQ